MDGFVETTASLNGYAGMCKACRTPIYGAYVALCSLSGGDKPNTYWHIPCSIRGPYLGPAVNDQDLSFTEEDLKVIALEILN